MVNPFICGCGSFHRQAEEDGEIFTPCSTPRSKHRRSSFKSKDVKNPYSDRGLDKFSKLLAELEEKKQKIYTQKGSEKISFVRFSYSSSNDLKPIVVRMRARQPEKSCSETYKEKYPVEFSSSAAKDPASTKDLGDHEDTSEKKMMKKGFSRKMLMEKLSRPSYYLPAVLVLMFVFLALFGRSFAVMCTSILWYLVPIIQKSSSNNSRRPRKKKDLARRASEKSIINIRHVNTKGLTSSPTSVLGGAIVDDFSPRSHGHRRSF